MFGWLRSWWNSLSSTSSHLGEAHAMYRERTSGSTYSTEDSAEKLEGFIKPAKRRGYTRYWFGLMDTNSETFLWSASSYDTHEEASQALLRAVNSRLLYTPTTTT